MNTSPKKIRPIHSGKLAPESKWVELAAAIAAICGAGFTIITAYRLKVKQ